MNFNVSAVLKRSVTLEMENSDIYETKEYQVLLDGREIKKATENVLTIQGLEPDRDYEVAVARDGICEKKTIHTEWESVLLNVKDFGAKGDGSQDDTSFIQAAIMACPKHGTLYFPSGSYLSRPLFLKSDMSIWLSEEAVLLGTANRNLYPLLPGMTKTTDGKGEYNLSSWEGNPETSFASLITGIDIENVEIFGDGIIDGNADQSDWWIDAKKKRVAWRPNTIFLCRAKHIRLQGVTVRNSPSWTIHPYYTDDIALYNVKIWNPSDSPNTDGFDPESCDGVLLLGCRISVGDDCIAIKSGKIYMSTNHHKIADHFVIRNSLLERGHGSVTVGSEAAGGVINVEVSQCIFDGTDRGLRIKTRRGRGPNTLYDQIHFHDLIMKDVLMPITLNMFYFCDPDGHSEYVQQQAPLPVDERTPKIGRIVAENIKCTGASACIVCAYGLPERYIESLVLRNIEAEFLPREERKPKQAIMMDDFPDMTGVSIYARNVERLVLQNLSIKGSDDEEPQLIHVNEYDSQNVVFHI